MNALEFEIFENYRDANTKMYHALIRKKPTGKYIDIKFLKQLINNLKQTSCQTLI